MHLFAVLGASIHVGSDDVSALDLLRLQRQAMVKTADEECLGLLVAIRLITLCVCDSMRVYTLKV
jgi:hypothetical protein